MTQYLAIITLCPPKADLIQNYIILATQHCKKLVVNCSATIITTFCSERHYLVVNVVTFTTNLVVNVTTQKLSVLWQLLVVTFTTVSIVTFTTVSSDVH